MTEGTIQWVDEDLVGYLCVCGAEMVLTSGEPRECYGCGRKLIGSVKVEVHEQTQMEGEVIS